MEKISLYPIEPDEAAHVLRAAGGIDPARLHTPESIAASGVCFALNTQAGRGVFVAEKRGSQLWIHGAGSTGSTGMIHDGMAVAEAMALQAGCDRVAFQTARPGLARIAKKRGYKIKGFILELEK